MRQKALREGMPMFQRKEPRFKPVDVNSKEFKEWFSGSKVVDAEGKPLRVYHGTGVKDFDEFKGAELGGDLGNHFSDQPITATFFSQFGGKGKIYPVYLSIKRPIYLNDFGRWHSQYMLNAIEDKTGIQISDSHPLRNFDDQDLREDSNVKSEFNKELISLLGQKGFDGIIYDNEGEGGVGYIAFSSTQIKSATTNTGEFSNQNPDIRFARKKQAEYAKNIGADTTLLKRGMDEANSVVQAIKEFSPPAGGFLDQLITSPEYAQHPIEKAVVEAALDRELDKVNIYHEIDYDKETDKNGWEVLKALIHKGKGLISKVGTRDLYNQDNKRISKDYRQVWDAIDHMDTHQRHWLDRPGVKGYRTELIEKGVSDSVIEAIDVFRRSQDKAFDFQMATMKEIMIAYGDVDPVIAIVKDPDTGKQKKYTLKDAYDEMGQHKGYYAPVFVKWATL